MAVFQIIFTVWLIFTIQLQGINVYSFNIPYCKSHSKVDFEYNGIVLWKFLPNSLKNVNDRNILKLKCKKYLLEKMFHQQNSDFV